MSRSDRVERAFACWCVRHAWDLLEPEGFPFTQAVRTAERYAEGECSRYWLGSMFEDAVDWRWARTGWSPAVAVSAGAFTAAARMYIRLAARATCQQDAGTAARDVTDYVAHAMACREAGRELADQQTGRGSSVPGVWPTRDARRRAFERFEERYRWHVGFYQRHHAYFEQLGWGPPPERFTALPASPTLSWFIQALLDRVMNTTPIDAPDALFRVVLAHPEIPDLWERCDRAEWLVWLLETAVRNRRLAFPEYRDVFAWWTLAGAAARDDPATAARLRSMTGLTAAVLSMRPDDWIDSRAQVGWFGPGGSPDLNTLGIVRHDLDVEEDVEDLYRASVFGVEHSDGITLYCERCATEYPDAFPMVLFDGSAYACSGCGVPFIAPMN